MLLSRRFNDKSISEIAYEVGFDDLSWFNRMFRRSFGVVPGGLRERPARTTADLTDATPPPGPAQ